MKKYLGLLFGGLLLTTVASANSIYAVRCSPIVINFTNSTGSSNFSCAPFTPPGTEQITSVEVFFLADYQFGETNVSKVDITFTPSAGITTWSLASFECVVSGDTSSNTNPNCHFSGTLTAPGTTFSSANGNDATLDLLAEAGFSVGVLSALGSPSGPVDQSSAGLIVEYTYGFVPEPMTMVLVGGGLLGVGLLAGKRRKKA